VPGTFAPAGAGVKLLKDDLARFDPDAATKPVAELMSLSP
jgi:hypothetical protein